MDAEFPKMERESFRELLEGWTLLKRLPTLADVADTAAFLASDRAGAITGTVANLTCGSSVELIARCGSHNSRSQCRRYSLHVVVILGWIDIASGGKVIVSKVYQTLGTLVRATLPAGLSRSARSCPAHGKSVDMVSRPAGARITWQKFAETVVIGVGRDGRIEAHAIPGQQVGHARSDGRSASGSSGVGCGHS